LTRAPEPVRAPENVGVNAPLFRRLVEPMEDGARRVVLDLGPARAETVAAFRRFRCRLDIADLAHQIDSLNAAETAGERRDILCRVLPARRAEHTDVVLCWDLLNYLGRPALTSLMTEIHERLAPDAQVHALITYSTPRMSAQPSRIFPGEDHRLVHAPVTSEEKPAPRYTPDDLSRCMQGYVVDRAALLRNGMQEFLFRR
jgi:hypothetical protein